MLELPVKNKNEYGIPCLLTLLRDDGSIINCDGYVYRNQDNRLCLIVNVAHYKTFVTALVTVKGRCEHIINYPLVPDISYIRNDTVCVLCSISNEAPQNIDVSIIPTLKHSFFWNGQKESKKDSKKSSKKNIED